MLFVRPTVGRIAGNGVVGGWGTGGGKVPPPKDEYVGKLGLFTTGKPVGPPPPKGIGPVDVEPAARGHTSAAADGVGNPDIVALSSSTIRLRNSCYKQ